MIGLGSDKKHLKFRFWLFAPLPKTSRFNSMIKHYHKQYSWIQIRQKDQIPSNPKLKCVAICVNFIGYFPIAVHFAPPPIEMGNIQKLFLATQENIRSGTGGKFPRCRFHTWQDFSDRVRGSKSTFHSSIILKENKVAKLRWTQNKL